MDLFVSGAKIVALVWLLAMAPQMVALLFRCALGPGIYRTGLLDFANAASAALLLIHGMP